MRWLMLPLAVVLLGQPVRAAELRDFFSIDQSDWTILMRPYVGAGASYIHHTGYDPDTILSAEQWEIGGKAFAGLAVTPALNAEIAYHFLNKTPLRPVIFPGEEKSYAVAGSLMLFTKRFRTPLEAVVHRWFIRGGGAYKHITDDSVLNPGRQVEDGAAFLVGAGVEVEFGNSWFGRLEYEYISKVGTDRAINVQHTPISASLGVRF
jgi:hypothetical protein